MTGSRQKYFIFFVAVDLVLVLLVISVVVNFNTQRSTYSNPTFRRNFIILERASTDLVPHRVYFDRRPGPAYSNATVVFVSVNGNYRENISGCEIDGIKSEKVNVVDIMLEKYIAKHFPVSHKDCFVYCFDMNLKENSEVSVLYRRNDEVIKEPVRSSSAIIPPNDIEEEDVVMVCAAGFGVIPYLDQWLMYQKTIGVKFIHINSDSSFVENLDISSTLVNYVRNGFVKMVVWENYLNSSQVFYFSQSLKYQDCALRYQGMFKYMMVIDFDEYFIPYNSNTTVLYYAKMLIKGNVGTVVLPREGYHCKYENISLQGDGNLTKVFDTTIHHHADQGKCIHLIKSLKQNSVHQSAPLPPYVISYYTSSPQKSQCYVAHLTPTERKGKKKCKI